MKGLNLSFAVLACSLSTLVLVGCAQMPNMGQRDKSVDQQSVIDKADQVRDLGHAATPGVSNAQGSYVSHKSVAYRPPSGHVTLNAQDAPLGSLVQQVAKDEYSISFVGHANPTRRVTVHINDDTIEEAVRELAAAAGYASVVKSDRKRIMIAPRATYVYKVPTTYLRAPPADFSVGGNTAAGGAGGSSGGGMGGGSGGGGGGSGGSSGGGGGQQIDASFKVEGETEDMTGDDLQEILQRVAGPGSKVVLDESTGLVSITSTGPGLNRATSYINSYASKANTRVRIHAAILQVSLEGAFSAGIDWQKIISMSSGTAELKLIAPNAPPTLATNSSPGSASSSVRSSQVSYTSNSVNAVIEALRSNTNVRVVSQPSLVAADGTPATLFSGTQLPYVGEVESNVSGLSGTSTSGASLSYVLNGLSLSFIPDAISDEWVNMQLIPALSRVTRFDTFQVGDNEIQGPEQALRQVYLQLLAPTNKTVILAGSQEEGGREGTVGTPLLSKIPVLGNLFKGLSRSKQRTQLVILLRTSVVPAPHTNPLVSQSI